MKAPDAARITAQTGFFVKPTHSEKCRLHASGRDEFIVYEGMSHSLRRDGRRGGSTTWHKFRCNDIECGAIAHVRWDVLMVFIAGLVHASKERT